MLTSKNLLEQKFDALENRLLELDMKFIDFHLKKFEQPHVYALDVECFYVMSHAAFEEFIEEICIYTLNEIENNYKSKQRRFSWGTLCLLHFDSQENSLDDRKWEDKQRLGDYMEDRLKGRKKELSDLAKVNNHGISVKYLKKLMLPIGIDIPQDPKMLGSLEILAKTRGTFAHSFSKTIRNIPSPEDAQNQIYDVLAMVKRLKDEALNLKYHQK